MRYPKQGNNEMTDAALIIEKKKYQHTCAPNTIWGWGKTDKQQTQPTKQKTCAKRLIFKLFEM